MIRSVFPLGSSFRRQQRSASDIPLSDRPHRVQDQLDYPQDTPASRARWEAPAHWREKV